jgi:antitoxin MazE
MRVRVQKWGNSLALRIPKPFAGDADVSEGTDVDLVVSEGRLVATPVRRRRPSLRRLLARITPKNLHGEVHSGPPVGREVL